VFFVVWPIPLEPGETSARPDLFPKEIPITRRYKRATSYHFPASK
jgi:hypothetical protein